MPSTVTRIKRQKNERVSETPEGGAVYTYSYLVLLSGYEKGDEKIAHNAELPDGVTPAADEESRLEAAGEVEDGTNLVVTAKETTHIRRLVWRTTITKGPYNPSFQGPPEDDSYWAVDISADGVENTEVVNHDGEGKVVANMFGRVFPAQFQQKFYDERITIRFRCKTISADVAEALRGKVNSDSVTLNIRGVNRAFAAKTLKLEAVRWSTVVSSTAETPETTFYSVEIILMCRKQTASIGGGEIGWTRKIPQMDYMYASVSLGKPDVRSPTPVYLKGDGTKANDGDSVVFAEKLFEKSVAFAPMLAGL